MKSKLFAVSLVGGALVLGACGKVKDAAKAADNTRQASDLMTTWGAEKCHGADLKIAGISTKTFLQFGGDTLTQVHEFYNDGKCAGQVMARIEYRGTFEVQGDASVPGAKNVQLHYDNAKVQALTKGGKKLIDTLFCGDSAWALGSVNDVTTKGRGVTCTLKSLPRNEFNIEKVENGVLLFGKLGWGSEQKESNRPSQLDSDNPFVKVNRHF